MQRIVARFNESQDRILVRYFVTAGIDQKTLIAIAGGTRPTLSACGATTSRDSPKFRAILPLDDLAPRSGVRLENYATGMRAGDDAPGAHVGRDQPPAVHSRCTTTRLCSARPALTRGAAAHDRGNWTGPAGT
jgi:hypothetical protein